MELLALVSLWLGVISLYLGFAAIQGVLLRTHPQPARAWLSWSAALGYAVLLFIPASVFVTRFLIWPVSLRIVLLSVALVLVWLGRRPTAPIPGEPNDRPGRLYFGGSMALVALWASAAALSRPSAALILLGAAAILAGWLLLQPRRLPQHLRAPPEVQ
jgi:hypothetical protein